MQKSEKSLRAIFEEALEIRDEVQRRNYLDEACQAHPAMRATIEELLEANESAGNFLAPNRPETTPEGFPFTEKEGDHIGRYRLLQKIGEGGCGVVYMAEQTESVRRRVALKIIKLGMDTRSVVARFEAERQALAMMDHPCIARVIDAGSTETGRPFFVMELVRGIKITDYCQKNNLSTKERLQLFIQVCHAVQHAHQKGIIHRDLKPSNILVTSNDGVPLPKVIDFGIAKATANIQLTDKTLFTRFEMFIGTPAYMSPEQAEFNAMDIDTRTDIYSLGVLLYELLTGHLPFEPETLMQSGIEALRKAIRENEPTRPSTRLSQELHHPLHHLATTETPSIPETDSQIKISTRRLNRLKETIAQLRGDLDWIILKALEKDRTRRYDTANGFAMDIERHLANEPVIARPPSRSYLLRKYVRRHKTPLSVLATIALVLILSSTYSLWKTKEAIEARKEADLSATQATLDRNTARLLSSQSDRLVAEQLLKQNQVQKALLYLSRSLKNDPENPAAFRRLMTTLTQRHVPLTTDNPTPFDVLGLEGHFNHQGTRLVVINPDLSLYFINTASGGRVRSKGKLENMNHGVQFQFTHDGTRAISMEIDGGHFQIWNMETGDLAAPAFNHASSGLNFIITPDDRLLISTGGDSHARFWDPMTGTEKYDSILLESPFKSFAIASNGTQLLLPQGYQSELLVWDIHPDRPPKLSKNQFPFTGESENIFMLNDISPDDKTLIVYHRKSIGSNLNPSLRVSTPWGTRSREVLAAWDIPTATLLWENDSIQETINNVEWSNDGTQLLIQGVSGHFQLRNGLDGNLVQPIAPNGHNAYRSGPDYQTWVGLDTANGRISFLDLESGIETLPSIETASPAFNLSLDSNSRQLSYFAFNQTNGLHQLDYSDSRALAYPLLSHVNGEFADIHPTWKTSLWITTLRKLVVYDNATGASLPSPLPPDTDTLEARFTEDGENLICLAPDRRTMSHLQWPTFQLTSKFTLKEPGHIGKWQTDQTASTLAFLVDPPGDWNYPGPKSLYLWNIQPNTEPFILDSIDGEYINVTISPNGKWILVTLRNAGATLYQKTDRWIKTPLLGSEPFTNGSFSHGGRWLALVSSRSGSKIYDLVEHQWSERQLPNREFGETTQVRFSNDDKWIFVTGLKKTPILTDYTQSRSDAMPAETGLLWDWHRGEIASDRFEFKDRHPVEFSPDGNRFLVTGQSGPEIIDIAPNTQNVPEWLYLFVENYCGYRFNSEGNVERSPKPPFYSKAQWTSALTEKDATSPLVNWGRWLMEVRSQRSISPETTLSFSDHIKHLLESNQPADIKEAWKLSPFDPRTMSQLSHHLANSEQQVDLHRSQWLANKALSKDPNSSGAWFTKAIFWVKEGNMTNALTAVNQALSNEEHNWLYHRLKAQVLKRLDQPEPAIDSFNQAIHHFSRLKDSSDQIALDDLKFEKIGLLNQLGRHAEAKSTEDPLHPIPPRAPSLSPQLIDLTQFYNAELSRNWHGHPGGNLSTLPPGLHSLNGTSFDIRGIIQLQCDMMIKNQRHNVLTNLYPQRIEGIPIHQKASRIHFLQASLYGNTYFAPKGTLVATYVFHFSDNQQSEMELRLGEQTRDWWIGKPTNAPAFSPEIGLELAWRCYIAEGNIGLYKTTWKNPRPDVPITSIDLISAMTVPGNFVMAITAE